MALLRKLERVIFFLLLIGVGVLGWRVLQTYPRSSRDQGYLKTFGTDLNAQRANRGMQLLLDSDQTRLTTDSAGTTRISWIPARVESPNRPHFWKKEVRVRQQKLQQETDSYTYPTPKGNQVLHFDFFPDSLPDRQFRTRLEVVGLPTIGSFEIPSSRSARTFRDSLLQEWKIRPNRQ